MADKELTVFVVDLHPAAAFSHDYLYEVLSGKLLKGLKTDYVSVVGYHSPLTKHELAEKKVFPGVNVLSNFETPSYEQLVRIRKELRVNDSWESSQSDSFQSFIFSLSLLEDTKTKAFTRNIVVLTSHESPLSSLTEQKADGIPNILKNLRVNMIVVVDGLEESSETYSQWALLKPSFAEFIIMSSKQARYTAQNVPPAKKVRPLPIYRGELRFGSDFFAVIEDRSYACEADDLALSWPVEVYPAAKKDVSSISFHDYILEDGRPIRLERKSSHYVWSKNEEYQRPEYPDEEDVDTKKFDKVEVESKDFTPGFKFSNFDLIALDDDLTESARLKIFSAFDILGFIKSESIPPAYLTSETFFVVPEKAATLRANLSHTILAKALLETESAALARFVRKQAKEVELGVLIPIKIKDGTKNSFNYLLVRLPFREDENIGNFPSLKEHKSDKIVPKLMEQFIESKTFTEQETKDSQSLHNHRVTMRTSQSSKLPLPNTSKEIFSTSSTSQVRFLNYVRKIIIRSLDEDDLDKFLQQKSLISNVLKSDSFASNFFNLRNCLSYSASSASFVDLSRRAKDTSRRLVDELDIKYVRKEDLKKKKPRKGGDTFDTKGYYGADEGEYDAVPDFGF
ncbi:hypothetical protein CJJ07_003638 [Candidozyma auris]|nr:hypothetical protein CJJ07_003638 [[Candida] auris]QEL59055.1 hypothetical protein CJJ09_001121 [[Candida] auris]